MLENINQSLQNVKLNQVVLCGILKNKIENEEPLAKQKKQHRERVSPGAIRNIYSCNKMSAVFSGKFLFDDICNSSEIDFTAAHLWEFFDNYKNFG